MNQRTVIILVVALLLTMVAFPVYRWLAPAIAAVQTMQSYKTYPTIPEAKQRLRTNPSDTKALQTLVLLPAHKLRNATMAQQQQILAEQLPYAERLYKLEPENTAYADSVAIILVGMKRYAEAVPILEKVAAAGTVHSDGAKSLLRKIRQRQHH